MLDLDETCGECALDLLDEFQPREDDDREDVERRKDQEF